MGLIQGIGKLFGNMENACANLTAEYTHKADSSVENENLQDHPAETINVKYTFDNSPKPEMPPADPDDGIEFLTTEKIKQNIDEIIRNESKSKSVTVICAYLELSDEYIKYLSKIDDVTLICGLENTLSQKENKLKKCPNIRFKFIKNLHAKCYMNDSTILLPSMNLNESFYKTKKQNIEIGIKIYKKENRELYENIEKEINSIKNFSFSPNYSEQSTATFLEKEKVHPNHTKAIRFLKTFGIISSVEDIITSAKKSITIVSPYLEISDNYLACLSTPVDKNLVFGKKEMRNSQKEKLKKIDELIVLYLEELHAKCYMNESKIIITSMNMLKKSEKNIEIGLEIYKEQNPKLFKAIEAEIRSISFDKANEYDINWKNTEGYCINCGNSILFNEKKTLCNSCYSDFKSAEKNYRKSYPYYELFYDSYFMESYCHRCGKSQSPATDKDKRGNPVYQIDIKHPFCKECWEIEKQ